MKLYRIALAQFGRRARDGFSGESGMRVEGRWHTKGKRLDYTSTNRALGAYERYVHFKTGQKVNPHYIWELTIPDKFVTKLSSYPRMTKTNRTECQETGDQWHTEGRTPGLMVPSFPVKGEFNVIVNSTHPDWRWPWVGRAKPFEFDPRLVGVFETYKN